MRTVVVGIGNDFRGDDGAGLFAARLLRSHSLRNTAIVELNGEVTRLVDYLQECDAAILIDAVQSQKPPGTIHHVDVSHNPLPNSGNQRSTHGITLASVIELARAGESFPKRVIIYGIEGESYDHSQNLTPPVAQAVKKVVALVSQEISSWE
ncbi:MAG: hydrogenase maturation protease [Ignavibacteriales bacterium]|nr:hydrogenase maturation protease [Ignavibacteriales bacterium]